ncbi:MAG: hypothetical protein ACREXN_15015, partial [Polaromonas sp.]
AMHLGAAATEFLRTQAGPQRQQTISPPRQQQAERLCAARRSGRAAFYCATSDFKSLPSSRRHQTRAIKLAIKREKLRGP